MSTRFQSAVILGALMLSLLFSSFLVIPERAQAVVGVPTNEAPGGLLSSTVISKIKNTLSLIEDITNTAATVAEYVNTYVFEPLAFVISGDILKAITGGIMEFVIGEANGTGVPQFVVDVQETLRTVSTSHALAFLKDFGENSNSPFASSIRTSIEDEYFSKTSLGGFWERNKSTLRDSSRFYTDDYLRGDWRRGGIHSWFALTTRTENNPYELHRNSQKKLQDITGRGGTNGATGARIEELRWGNGFISWCGGAFGDDYKLPEGQETSHPGDDCIDKDGNTLKIKTPGVVITDALNRAFSSEQDKIVRMGNVGPQVNEILGNVATVVQTVEFAKNILGGSGSGGLAGAGTRSSSRTDSRLEQHTTTGFLGTTQSGVYQSSSGVGADILARATQYENAWTIIETSANSASTALNDLKASCASYASQAEVALTGPVASVLTQASVASSLIATTRTIITELQADIAVSNTSTTENFLPRIQALNTLTPTSGDLSDATTKASVFNSAVATPEGSLVVSGESLVDQMELIRVNALALKVSCTFESEAFLSSELL